MSSSIQSHDEEKKISKHCVHTKNIYSLMDLPKKGDSYKTLTKHLETCAVCTEEFQMFQAHAAMAKVHIPKAIMDHDLRESFEREVTELFKAMDLNDRELLKKNVKKGFLFLDSMGIDFIKNLASKTMIKAYIVALFTFIFLKLFF